ncbi:hypothetical protein LguiB_025115 [Lonicera macranthoides]
MYTGESKINATSKLSLLNGRRRAGYDRRATEELLWYELSYLEAKGGMKKGDRVRQIGVGSGFKCNSAIWKCNRTIQASTSAWVDCIERYSVHTPDMVKFQSN